MRTPSAWKVQINTSFASRPIRLLARSRISAAALLVKVMAAMRLASRPAWISRADLVRDHARLARAGAGQHQAGPVHVVDSFLLGEIQAGGHREGRSGEGTAEGSGESYRRGRQRPDILSLPSCAENTPVLDILLVTFPFFALVLAGYVAARRRMLPFEATRALSVARRVRSFKRGFDQLIEHCFKRPRQVSHGLTRCENLDQPRTNVLGQRHNHSVD